MERLLVGAGFVASLRTQPLPTANITKALSFRPASRRQGKARNLIKVNRTVVIKNIVSAKKAIG
jgi:hypothetical protein